MLNVISNLLEKVDTLIIGGGMAYTFVKAQGYEVVFDCETLILRAATVRAAGVLMQYRPAAAPNTTKRGVVSYRFR